MRLNLGISFLSLILLNSACFFNSQNNQNTNIVEPSQIDISAPNVNLSKLLEISKLPADLARCEKINQIIDQSEFSNARWGIIAICLKDGRIACGRDAQKLFNPASTEKLITSIVALDRLGADFTWKTSLYSNQKIENGTLTGDLILYGTGSPDFSEDSIDQLVNDLKNKGLRQIKGSIIGDESYFKGDKIGDGWAWGELQWYYGAEASASNL